MSDLYLDLRDKPRVVDFLVEAAPYAKDKDRADADKAVKSYQDGEHVATDKLAETARKLSIATWPARYAVRHFFGHEGAEQEWEGVLAAVRPSTAHLMKRVRKATKAATLDEVLRHEDAASALRDEEAREIDLARMHIREDCWKMNNASLAKIVKDGERERDGYVKRLRQMREIAEGLPLVLQDEVFSKMKHYEDRVMFAGEVVPFEILDEEIKYYTEQKEISPLES